MEHNKDPLKAPNEAALEIIEQLQDRSQLTTLYPKPHKQWSGRLLSADERSTKRDAHLEEISRSIRKHFLSIGFLIPLPIFLFVLFALTGQQFIKSAEDFAHYIIPVVVILLLLTWLTFVSLKKVQKIFYDHAIAIGPFYLTLILLLLPAGIVSYFLTEALHGSQAIPAAAIVGLSEILLSVILSFFLLFIWTTPKLSGRSKMSVILLVGGALTIAAAVCIAVHIVNHL